MAILVAAEQALAEKGVHAARMDDIANRAGLAVGTLYNYFDDRDELVSALLELRRRELIQRFDATLEAEPATGFVARLESFIVAAFEHLESHRTLYRLLLHEELGPSRKYGAKRTMMSEFLARADRLIALGVAEGVLREDDAPLFGAMLVGLMRGVVLRSLDTSGPSLSDSIAPLMRLFLHGGARPP